LQGGVEFEAAAVGAKGHRAAVLAVGLAVGEAVAGDDFPPDLVVIDLDLLKGDALVLQDLLELPVLEEDRGGLAVDEPEGPVHHHAEQSGQPGNVIRPKLSPPLFTSLLHESVLRKGHVKG
jgi:hypothetical protein